MLWHLVIDANGQKKKKTQWSYCSYRGISKIFCALKKKKHILKIGRLILWTQEILTLSPPIRNWSNFCTQPKKKQAKPILKKTSNFVLSTPRSSKREWHTETAPPNIGLFFVRVHLSSMNKEMVDVSFHVYLWAQPYLPSTTTSLCEYHHKSPGRKKVCCLPCR